MRRIDWLNVAVWGSLIFLWVAVSLLIGFEL